MTTKSGCSNAWSGFGARGWNITDNMICAAATGKSPLIAPENGRFAVVRYLKEIPGDLQLILLTQTYVLLALASVAAMSTQVS